MIKSHQNWVSKCTVAACIATTGVAITFVTHQNRKLATASHQLQVTTTLVAFQDDPSNHEHQRGGSTFTYQGALADSDGDPITSTIPLTFEHWARVDGELTLESTTTLNTLTFDDQGRFSALIPLPSPFRLSKFQSHFLRVIESSTGDIIANEIPIQPVPESIVSQYADFANFADYADTAENAKHADYADDAGNAGFAIRAQQMLDDTTVDLTLQPPYRNWQGTDYAPARARKTNKTVFLSGFIQTNGPLDMGTTITTLPENMRPEHQEVFWVYTDTPDNNGHREIRIYPDGNVIIHTGVYPGSISLSGIVFQAAP